MTVFGQYSRYYDLLYRDKDYQGETDFVAHMLAPHIGGEGAILELGCGTGKHAQLLAEKGYSVHGIDQSDEMLDVANGRIAQLPDVVAKRLYFARGDARNYETTQRFDAVISLFHVASYQITNDDLLAMVQTAATHLKPGGVFLFDYWYGPAVLTDRPVPRKKHMESDEIDVTRVATPTMYAERSVVDVDYQVTIRDKQTGEVDILNEKHAMRYLFSPEIDLLARMCRLQVKESFEWLTGKAPGYDSWNVCSLLVK
jgi:SAM-dependent methyltransferase